MTQQVAAIELPNSSVRFIYRLEGYGWAHADIHVGNSHLKLTASNLGPGVEGLLAAAEALLDGAQVSEAVFEEEPGEVRWIFTQRGDLVWVRIEAIRGTRGLPTRWGRQPSIVLLERSTTLPELVEAITAGAEELLQREGQVGYLEKWWSSRFPLRLLNSVQKKAGLPETPIPALKLPEPDHGREELTRRWSELVAGSEPLPETVEWLTSDDAHGGGEVMTEGVLALSASLRETSSAESLQESLTKWQASAALYDDDPMGWHRLKLMRRLARSMKCSLWAASADVISYWEPLLDRADIETVIREHEAETGRPI